MFDNVEYNAGGALLRMLHAYLVRDSLDYAAGTVSRANATTWSLRRLLAAPPQATLTTLADTPLARTHAQLRNAHSRGTADANGSPRTTAPGQALQTICHGGQCVHSPAHNVHTSDVRSAPATDPPGRSVLSQLPQSRKLLQNDAAAAALPQWAADPFLGSMTLYLGTHRGSSAEGAAVGAAMSQDTGLPVAHWVDMWVFQRGVPLLHVALGAGNASLVFSQSRFNTCALCFDLCNFPADNVTL